MNEIRKVTEEELKTLYSIYPTGRPLYFFSPMAPQGFSLVAAFSNLLAKLRLVEGIPSWVKQDCAIAHRELLESATLLPYARKQYNLGNPTTFEVSTDVTFICAREKKGDKRILILLTEKDAWMIAAWNGETAESQPFPKLGCSIVIPIKYNKKEVEIKRQNAINQAEEDIRKMKEEDGSIFTRLFR